MASRNAIKNIQALRIEAQAFLREIRANTDRTYEQVIITSSGYSDDFMGAIAAIVNELLSTEQQQRNPMSEGDVLFALNFIDLLTTLNYEIVPMNIYRDDDETQGTQPSA